MANPCANFDSVRVARDPQRGNSLILALVVLTALGTLSMLTTFSVRGGIQTTANDRFHAIALYSAESGAAVAMDFLRTNIDATLGWKAYVSANNASPPSPSAIPGNSVASGTSGNPFSNDMLASYKIEIYNNRDDSGYATGLDNDKRVIVRSTGYGPDGAVAIIEWEIKSNVGSSTRPCPSYGQKNESEDNSARNDCLGTIDTTQSGTYSP
ncbi:MAG: hypothetical protein JWO36_7006 [Myxococcales bacterium]|nr:hypothetical protein [Myxococcales bacterium]